MKEKNRNLSKVRNKRSKGPFVMSVFSTVATIFMFFATPFHEMPAFFNDTISFVLCMIVAFLLIISILVSMERDEELLGENQIINLRDNWGFGFAVALVLAAKPFSLLATKIALEQQNDIAIQAIRYYGTMGVLLLVWIGLLLFSYERPIIVDSIKLVNEEN